MEKQEMDRLRKYTLSYRHLKEKYARLYRRWITSVKVLDTPADNNEGDPRLISGQFFDDDLRMQRQDADNVFTARSERVQRRGRISNRRELACGRRCSGTVIAERVTPRRTSRKQAPASDDEATGTDVKSNAFDDVPEEAKNGHHKTRPDMGDGAAGPSAQ